MRAPLVVLATALFTGASADAALATETNHLTMGAGAALVRATAEAERAGVVAIDGSDQTVGVGIPRREPLPLTFVIELPAPTTFTRFQTPPFNAFGSADGRHIQRLRIEGSDTSPDEGFKPLVDAQLARDGEKTQRFPVAEPRPVRWVRVTMVDRHVAPEADFSPHNFTELEGYGVQAPIERTQDAFTGQWRIRRKGLNDVPGVNVITLTQAGGKISGCQRVGGHATRVNGAVVDGLAQLVAEDADGGREPFTAVALSDGSLAGVRVAGQTRPFYAAPDAEDEEACPKPLSDNPVTSALQAGQTAVLYGIYFDLNEAVIRGDAKPALEELLAALEATPDLAVTVEGHTDSAGSDAHNFDLSERRAAAVAAWLTERGVDAERLTPVGKGEGDPIADNATSSGRALNRRVQIVPAAATGGE